MEFSDAAKAWLGSGDACSKCPNGHCEGADKADVFKQIWRALYAAVPTPSLEPHHLGAPPEPSCGRDLHRRQRGGLDTNCGIFALTDLRELLRGSPPCCDASTAAEGREWAQLILWTGSDLLLEVTGPAGDSRFVNPKHYRHLPSEIAHHWAAAVPQHHRIQARNGYPRWLSGRSSWRGESGTWAPFLHGTPPGQREVRGWSQGPSFSSRRTATRPGLP